MLASIRAFFYERDVLEVETPCLSWAGTTDPSIESFKAVGQLGTLFLQTSPEFAMKRLLAAGSGDIYQIAKAFRDGESGCFHNPEFSLLEWYRLGIDHHALMEEVVELVCSLRPAASSALKVVKVSYQNLCQSELGIDSL